LPIHVRRPSCAPALSQPLPQTPLLLSLLLLLPPPPLLLRAPLRQPRLQFDQWLRMLHACELGLLLDGGDPGGCCLLLCGWGRGPGLRIWRRSRKRHFVVRMLPPARPCLDDIDKILETHQLTLSHYTEFSLWVYVPYGFCQNGTTLRRPASVTFDEFYFLRTAFRFGDRSAHAITQSQQITKDSKPIVPAAP
jgi:hypothetical protein